jgi:hypothetical protein
MGKKVTIYSGESVKNTLDQLKRIADKIEEKENRSIMRAFWSVLAEKPFIGKKRVK